MLQNKPDFLEQTTHVAHGPVGLGPCCSQVFRNLILWGSTQGVPLQMGPLGFSTCRGMPRQLFGTYLLTRKPGVFILTEVHPWIPI